MYKLLLCLRYLRTRYIALASIISVTLGVATMIVVNSVMAGFRTEMYDRLHDVLSDIVIRAHSLDGIVDPDTLMAEATEVIGDDLESMTATVQVPAGITFQVGGQWITRQVMLTGVDEKTYAQVGDFGKYLLHPENRRQLGFLLHENGYDDRLPSAGWEGRRRRIGFEREYVRQLEEVQRRERQWNAGDGDSPEETADEPEAADRETAFYPLMPLPDDSAPSERPAESANVQPKAAGPQPEAAGPQPKAAGPQPEAAGPQPEAAGPQPEVAGPQPEATDPFADRGDVAASVFDPMTEQHPGIILGIGLSSVRHRDPETGELKEHFLCTPGDDIRLSFPSAGTPPRWVTEQCTLVDFYECKMAEYDGSFAFMPLRRLQELRGMVDPMTGAGAATAVQIKLVEGADLTAVVARLQQRFPATQYPFQIQTWMQMQSSLFEAVRMETIILNILLFLIIAVAGFGILATFYMIVVEKTRDVGVLKALGAPGGGVMSIFLSYGLSLGIVGSGVGMVLGLLFVVYINKIAAVLEYFSGREVFDPEIYFLQEIPAIINPWTVAWIVFGAMMIAILASVLPALRAARMHPVEALRYE